MNEKYKELSTKKMIDLVVELKVDWLAASSKEEKITIKSKAVELLEEINIRLSKENPLKIIKWESLIV